MALQATITNTTTGETMHLHDGDQLTWLAPSLWVLEHSARVVNEWAETFQLAPPDLTHS
jgi:hypothetical protein